MSISLEVLWLLWRLCGTRCVTLRLIWCTFWNVHVFWDMATGPWPAAMDTFPLQFTEKQLCTTLKVPKPRTSYAAWLHQAALPTDLVYITAIRTAVHISRLNWSAVGHIWIAPLSVLSAADAAVSVRPLLPAHWTQLQMVSPLMQYPVQVRLYSICPCACHGDTWWGEV